MSTPLVEISGVVKHAAGPRPLRLQRLQVDRGERYTLSGVDAASAETLVHLMTGAALPEEGDVRIAGVSTRDIATDTAWLAALDRFGLVTNRAVLLDRLSLGDNLALPLTLEIDPIPRAVRPKIEGLADEIGLGRAALATIAGELSPEARARLHLGRAIAADPALLLVEYPTAPFGDEAVAAFGRTLRQIAETRGLGWIVLTDDERLARAAGGTRLTLDPATGALARAGWLRRLLG